MGQTCSCSCQDENFMICNKGPGNVNIAPDLDPRQKGYSKEDYDTVGQTEIRMASPKHEIFSQQLLSAQNSKSTGVSMGASPFYHSFSEKDLIQVKDLLLPDGALYNGQVRKCDEGIQLIRHGYGNIIWKDGARYDGQWVDGKATGNGIFHHINGDVYQGEFRNDKANGKGTYTHKEGSRYEGEWKDDIKHGVGKETWEDGSFYEGQFFEGVKHGQGTYFWADGSRYSGQWMNGVIEGHGVYIWPDNRKFEGGWQNNKLHGKGVYTWPDGRKYDGYYSEDKKCGFGTYYWPNGRVYEGYWQDGKQHGSGKLTNSKGVTKAGIWDMGTVIQWIGDRDNNDASTKNRSGANSFSKSIDV